MNKQSDTLFVVQIIIWGTVFLLCFLFGIDYWRSKKKTAVLSITEYYTTSGWFGAKKIMAKTDHGYMIIPMDVYTHRKDHLKIQRITCDFYQGRITGSWYKKIFKLPKFNN